MEIKMQSILKTKYSIGDKLILIHNSWTPEAKIIQGVVIKELKITFMEDMSIKSLRDNIFLSKDIHITYTTNGNNTIRERGDSISYQGVGNNIFTNLEEATKEMNKTLATYIGYSENTIRENQKTINLLQKRLDNK